jgi:hypothetical protein
MRIIDFVRIRTDAINNILIKNKDGFMIVSGTIRDNTLPNLIEGTLKLSVTRTETFLGANNIDYYFTLSCPKVTR